ncbi:MAG: PqqD family protein [Candidatus Hydrogenedentota bacterium]
MNDSRQRLKGLALSDTGFLFDPITGHMYTLNRTGSEILKWLRDGIPEHFLPGRIAELFDVTEDEAERDCAAFLKLLHEFRLLEA